MRTAASGRMIVNVVIVQSQEQAIIPGQLGCVVLVVGIQDMTGMGPQPYLAVAAPPSIDRPSASIATPCP